MIKKMKENASMLLLLFALISSIFTGFNVLAKQSDLDSLEARVIFNETAARKKELRQIVYECKTRYGSDYSSAPDGLTRQMCIDAVIELEELKEKGG